uniref:hypothetical protein n=1 Tax=Escherichia coli TaxID=562 RepID=UPI001A7E0F9C
QAKPSQAKPSQAKPSQAKAGNLCTAPRFSAAPSCLSLSVRAPVFRYCPVRSVNASKQNNTGIAPSVKESHRALPLLHLEKEN